MVTIDITTAVLDVLKSIRKPAEADEIAFRVRSTPSSARAELELLLEAKLVKKTNKTHYSLAKEEQKLSWLEAAFTRNGNPSL